MSKTAEKPEPLGLKAQLPFEVKTEITIETVKKLGLLIQKMVIDMKKKPPTEAAIDYVSIRAAVDGLGEAMKVLNNLKHEAQYDVLPKVYEAGKATSINLDIGFRVGLSGYVYASMLDKEKGHEWLRKNGHGDLIQETVNSSTLSAFAGQQLEGNVDLPDTIFKISTGQRASVTKIPKPKK